MDYRSAYIRRSRKGSRLKQRLAAVGLLGVAACAGLYALAMNESAAPALSARAHAPADTAALAPTVLRTAAQVEAQEKTRKTRRVYPYSIVPGGLADRRELARAVVIDKVVAEHYAAFETARATVKTVDKPRAVYVSYRKGDKVFWTAKKLQLAEGETLLSDGQNEIRTRCGNRISDVPQLPVEAKGPSEEELDAAVEVAEDDAGEGTVAHVGFAVDGNPAGHGYQLKTFGSGSAAQNGGTRPTRTGVGMPSLPGSGLGAAWAGGTLPPTLDGKVSSDASGTGSAGTSTTGTNTGTTNTGTTGTGTPGTGTSGTGTSGTGTPVTGTSGSGTGTPGTVTSGTSPSGTGTSGTGATKPGGTKPGGPKTGGSTPGGPKTTTPSTGTPTTGTPTTGSPTTGTPSTGTPATGEQHAAAPVTNGSDTGNTGGVKTGDTSTGTGTGTKDVPSGGTTPDSGTPTGGAQPTVLPDAPVLPPADPGTKPPAVPGTLLPPTTDLPGPTSGPAKAPVKHADVPEPGSLWLAATGVAALLASRRAKKRTRD